MSRHLKISELSNKELEKISKDLCVEKEASKYAFSQKPEYITLANKTNIQMRRL